MDKGLLNINSMKRFTKEMQLEVVKSIVSGDYFMKEAMERYGIKSHGTLKRWLKKHLVEAKLLLYAEQDNVTFNLSDCDKEKIVNEEREKKESQHIALNEKIIYQYKIIALHEHIRLLETVNSELRKNRNELLIEVKRLKER